MVNNTLLFSISHCLTTLLLIPVFKFFERSCSVVPSVAKGYMYALGFNTTVLKSSFRRIPVSVSASLVVSENSR